MKLKRDISVAGKHTKSVTGMQVVIKELCSRQIFKHIRRFILFWIEVRLHNFFTSRKLMKTWSIHEVWTRVNSDVSSKHIIYGIRIISSIISYNYALFRSRDHRAKHVNVRAHRNCLGRGWLKRWAKDMHYYCRVIRCRERIMLKTWSPSDWKGHLAVP